MYELQGKRPATVVDTRPLAVLSAPYHRKAALIAEVNKLAARGDIRPQRARPGYNTETGQWEIPVLMLRPAPPAWRRPAAIAAGVLAILGSLAGLGWWVISSLLPAPLALFLIAMLAALAVFARMGRTTEVRVVTSSTVRVRH